MWYTKFLKMSSKLWICKLYSIWWKLFFCQFYSITAGCNFNNQLLETIFYLLSVSWIKTNGVSSLHIVFWPPTVHGYWLVFKKVYSKSICMASSIPPSQSGRGKWEISSDTRIEISFNGEYANRTKLCLLVRLPYCHHE